MRDAQTQKDRKDEGQRKNNRSDGGEGHRVIEREKPSGNERGNNRAKQQGASKTQVSTNKTECGNAKPRIAKTGQNMNQ